ncbi:MAG: sulfite exporter TauE/SafE family protein [Alphaproteobacteria bacterium]|nr:sulfite exporter TauE/SafE family protein [Alphaproteobacteria bacterium]
MMHWIMLALALLAAGALVGFLAGVFGVGGGTVAVPILYEVFVAFGVPDELRMPLCAGTSLALIIPTSIASYVTHRRSQAVDLALLKIWSVPIIAGAIGGTILARHAPGLVFKVAFILVALATAGRLMFPDRLPQLGEVPRLLRAPYGLLIGASAALIGIGGGLLSNMIMTLHGRAIHQAVATSAGVGVMVSVPGALGYMAAGWDRIGLPPFSVGFVSVAAVLALMPASFLTARIGATVAHRVAKHRLEVCFAVYLLLVSAQFGATLVLA